MKELKDKNFICSQNGTINKDSIGWSRSIFSNCDIDFGYFRKKIWNHYMWMNEDYICAFAIVKLDYAGFIFIDFYDLKNKEEKHKEITIPLCNGIIVNNSIGSYAHFQNKDMYINIIRVNDKLHTIIKWDEIDIDAKIILEEESLNVLIPWSEKKFHYTSKQFPLKSQGNICIGKDQIQKIDLSDSMGFIDYGRGIWEREKSWYWLTCGFEKEESKIGLNLGAKWTDNTGNNENGIKIDGVLYKINCDVKFEKLDKETWSIKSIDCEDIDLTFNIINEYNKLNNKVIVKSSLKQHIGKLSGSVKVDNNEFLFEDEICWLEDHYAKW